MSKSTDLRAMQQSLSSRRPDAVMEEEMSQTVFGRMQQEASPPMEIDVCDVVDSPYQQTVMDPEHVEELASLIAADGLNSPIVVRKRADGKYELIAGRHRHAAFKRLARPKIPAYVRSYTDAQAARMLTADNALHRKLTDFELYLHAAMLEAGNFARTKDELAAVLGVATRQQVYNILAFGKLPSGAIAILREKPDLIGGNAAFKMQRYCEKHGELVTELVRQLANERLTQAAVLAKLERADQPPAPQKESAERHELGIGDGTNAVKLVSAGDGIKITGAIDHAKLWALIQANLENLRKTV